MGKMRKIEEELLTAAKKEYPSFTRGDIIKVLYRIREKDKERIHPLEGVVLKIQGQMHRKSFTIRRTAFGETYEVTFPYYSPNISNIEVVKVGKRKPRRARLYYLRNRTGKKAFQT